MKSGKSKGTLKEDREQRLVSTGLTWSGSVQTNKWANMMEELTIYVKEKVCFMILLFFNGRSVLKCNLKLASFLIFDEDTRRERMGWQCTKKL